MDDGPGPIGRQRLPRRAGLPPLPPLHPALLLLVGGIALVELVLTLADAGILGHPSWRYVAVAFGGFHDAVFDGRIPPLWPGQDWAMFLTHAALHGDFLHLLMNMAVLLALGKLARAMVGSLRTLLLFPLGAAAGALAFGLLATTDGPMVGASGAVFAYLGLWLRADHAARRRFGTTIRPVLSTLAGLVIANLALWVAFSGLVAWEAHLGGFLAGWLCGILWNAVMDPDAWRHAGRQG